MAPMLIRCRNQEWSSAARASTLRTAAFIVTASKSAPITRRTTSTENGVTAAVRRAITFLSDHYFLGKCVWARIWRTSARALRRNRRVLRRSGLQLLQRRPLSRVASPAAAAANATPAASASPAGGPPWPVQTSGQPPMYSAAWHHVHLFSPRSINVDSDMPSYRFLYRARRISDARSADALQLTGSDTPSEGWEVLPTFDAKCLVAYLMSLNQSHPLKEVRSAAPTGAAPAVPAPAASPAPAK